MLKSGRRTVATTQSPGRNSVTSDPLFGLPGTAYFVCSWSIVLRPQIPSFHLLVVFPSWTFRVRTHPRSSHDNLHPIQIRRQRQDLFANYILIRGPGGQFDCGTGSGDLGKTVAFARPF